MSNRIYVPTVSEELSARTGRQIAVWERALPDYVRFELVFEVYGDEYQALADVAQGAVARVGQFDWELIIDTISKLFATFDEIRKWDDDHD